MSGLYRSRVSDELEETASRFVSSINEDERIFMEDIEGTEAHNIMLHEQGIIKRDDLKKILFALEELRSNKEKTSSEYEDIHEFIEAYVIEKVGIEAGGRLHTGRSRNDQVALDIRMRVRNDLNDVSEMVLDLIEVLLKSAEKYFDSLMVLYTHTQPAQIGVFSHYLLAYTDMLFRDLLRLQDCFRRVNLSPLGAGPIGGSGLNINRSRTASLLGFDGVLENSIDAVSSRDFALETTSALTILMSGLSRIAEDFIIWSSSEFGYLELADEYVSTSSVMPQKRNPCTLELIRGKTGHVYGALISLFTMIKGLSTGYNRDLQETKPPLWACFDAVKSSLEVLTGVISTLKVDEKRMQKIAEESLVMATDLAEQLVKKTSLSFREAHRLVGNLLKMLPTKNLSDKHQLIPGFLEDLSKKILGKKIDISLDMIENALDLRSCLLERKTVGSPFPREVKRMIKSRREMLKNSRADLASRVNSLEKARESLRASVKTFTEH